MKARRAVLAAALCAAAAHPARASLPEDTDTVAAGYRARGADVRVLRPRFLSAGSPVDVVLPADIARRKCATVTVLGAISTAFVLRLPSPDSGLPEQLQSAAGVASVRRCGAELGHLDDLAVELRSPHAIVEMVAAASDEPLPDPVASLPHRDPGTPPRPVRPGPAPPAGPLAARGEAAEARLRAEGGELERRLLPTDAEGSGQVLLQLEPGCHRFSVLGLPSEDGKSSGDVDVELVWVSGEVADTDRTESPDAMLLACTGDPRAAVLEFAGSAPRAPLVLLHSRTLLPAKIPESFGAEARARIGRALLERHLSAPSEPPHFASLGVAGLTSMPIELEAGQCYLAALAVVQGDAKLLALTAVTGSRRAFAHTDEDRGAVVLTFCAGVSRRARLDAEVHGTALVWALGLFPVARAPLGEVQP